MLSEKMGRRKFMKNMSSAFLGVATGHLLGSLPFAHAEKKPVLEFRTLGKTGLKVTTLSMGVMNCSDPAVLLRAFDLGINFYDTGVLGYPQSEYGRFERGYLISFSLDSLP